MHMRYKILLLLSITVYFNFQSHAAFEQESEQLCANPFSDQMPTGKQTVLQQWFNAALKGHLSTIQKLSKVVDINAQDAHGTTAFISAAHAKHENVVMFLMQVPDININIQDKHGSTALILASMCGNENIVQLLLTCDKININAQDKQGYTALLWAAANSESKIVKLLLEAPGINVHIQAKSGKNALMFLASRDLENTKYLLEMPGININARDEYSKTALMWAEENYPEIARLIQDKINELTSKAFNAITVNNLEDLKIIIAQLGTEIIDGSYFAAATTDSKGNTLLDRAFAANKPEIVLYLLSLAKDPREELARLPFEAIQPTTDLFQFCLELAYNKEPKKIESTAKKGEVSTSADKSCAQCATSSCTKRCGGCKKVHYCSADCQKAHWKIHKKTCTKS